MRGDWNGSQGIGWEGVD